MKKLPKTADSCRVEEHERKTAEIEKSNQQTAPIQPTLPQPGDLEQIEALENELIAARDLIGDLAEKPERGKRKERTGEQAWDAMGNLMAWSLRSINFPKLHPMASHTFKRGVGRERDSGRSIERAQVNQLKNTRKSWVISQRNGSDRFSKDASSDEVFLFKASGDLRNLLEQAKLEAKLGSEGQAGDKLCKCNCRTRL